MEYSNTKVKTSLARILFIILMASLAFVILEFSTSQILLNLRKNKPITITFLTSPPAVLKYYPMQNKVHIAQFNSDKQFGGASAISINCRGACFTPAHKTNFTKFWDKSKNYILNRQSKPQLFLQLTSEYLKAYAQKRCNINIGEFIALIFALNGLKTSDFLIATAKNTDKYLLSDLSLENRSKPVMLKVFNATDKKGLARQVTDYLRFLNSKDIVKIDVVHYGNWNKKANKSSIVINGGHFLKVSEMAKKLGLDYTEILFKKTKSSFADASLIIGDDAKFLKDTKWKLHEMLN